MIINKKVSNIILNNIFNYTKFEDLESIYKFLDNYDYEIDDKNKDDYNSLCIKLIDNNFNLASIISCRVDSIIEYIDPIIDLIIRKYFICDLYNDFISSSYEKFKPSQISLIFQECLKYTESIDVYVYNKIPLILKKIINYDREKTIGIFNNILNRNLICNENIGNETFSIYEIIDKLLDNNQKENYVNNIITNCSHDYASLEKIKSVNANLSIQILEKIYNCYCNNINNSDTYKIIKNIFNFNFNTFKSNGKIQMYHDFVINNIIYSSDISKDIKILDDSNIINISLLINVYIKNEFDKINDKYLNNFLKNKTLMSEENLDFNSILNSELSIIQIDKLSSIIDEQKLKYIIKQINYENTNQLFYNNLFKVLEIFNNNRLYFTLYKSIMDNEGNVDLKKNLINCYILNKKIRFNKEEKIELNEMVVKEIAKSTDSDYIKFNEILNSRFNNNKILNDETVK